MLGGDWICGLGWVSPATRGVWLQEQDCKGGRELAIAKIASNRRPQRNTGQLSNLASWHGLIMNLSGQEPFGRWLATYLPTYLGG